MPKHHIIISGTGRAGTTFLVQLLTELELDTGFPYWCAVDRQRFFLKAKEYPDP